MYTIPLPTCTNTLTTVGEEVAEPTVYVGCTVTATCRSPCGRIAGVWTALAVTMVPGAYAGINTSQNLVKQGTKPGSAILSIALDAASSEGKMYTHSVSVVPSVPKMRPDVIDPCDGLSNAAFK